MSEMKVTASEVIDSSVWLGYLLYGTHKEIVDQEKTFILSALSFFEIKKKIVKSSLENEHKERSLEFLKNKSLMIAVDEAVADKSVECAIKYDLGTADSIIYATAILNNSILTTSDNDFRGLPNVKLV